MSVGWSARSGRGPERGEDERRAPNKACSRIRVGFGNEPRRDVPLSFCVGRLGQRLGPNPWGGAERDQGGCWLNGLVVVRLVAGIASGVAGAWFGVCGSRSRIRHQRAAAGWSSGSGPAAAADRTSWVASKPDRVRLLNLS